MATGGSSCNGFGSALTVVGSVESGIAELVSCFTGFSSGLTGLGGGLGGFGKIGLLGTGLGVSAAGFCVRYGGLVLVGMDVGKAVDEEEDVDVEGLAVLGLKVKS